MIAPQRGRGEGTSKLIDELGSRMIHEIDGVDHLTYKVSFARAAVAMMIRAAILRLSCGIGVRARYL